MRSCLFMWKIGESGRIAPRVSRRVSLQAGFLGLGGLGLSDLLRLRAHGASQNTGKSVILIWLDGGPSQLESYDPKPDAPPEFRGPFGVAATNVAGTFVSELMEHQSRIVDKLAIVRSVHHGTGDHFAGAHWMLTGRFGATTASPHPRFPSLGASVSRLCGSRCEGMPPYVGLPAAESVYMFPGYHGAAYWGNAYNPFDVDSQNKYLHHTYKTTISRPSILGAMTDVDGSRLRTRSELRVALDRLRRDSDQKHSMDALDSFQQQAVQMIAGGEAAKGFDISAEPPAAVERYGDNPWGRYTLMARRLVEAGVTFVTVDMPHWDHHSSLVEGHAPNMRAMDRAVAALVADLAERGLLDTTLVLVMGEFGRTPKVNTGQPGIPIPGRDHWGDAISVMLAGGGLKGGVVVGETNARAEHPIDRPLEPHDILATVYHVMGIDPRTTFPDHAGRPVAILPAGEPIRELL